MRSISYDSSQFPKPRISALPIPSLTAFSINSPSIATGVLTLKHVLHVHSGRYAIALALKHAGVGFGDSVLLPAYHCLAMVEPLRLAGIKPVFYPINANLSIDPTEIEKHVTEIKAIIVVHYFGFPQNFSSIRHLANRFGLILIEDCAHTCFGKVNNLAVGSLGDYAIASTMKFFPIGHGGIVASSRHQLTQVNLINPSLKVNIKTAINLLEEAKEYERLGSLSGFFDFIIKIKNRLMRIKKQHDIKLQTAEDAHTKLEKTPEYAVDANRLYWKSSRVSQFLIRHTNTQELIKTRQKYYRMFLNVLSNRNDCHPLFSTLSDDVVPQVFPLYVNRSLPVFIQLKKQGIPIIRFGEFLDEKITDQFCSVSIDYSEHVLQFPCHQTLKNDEVEWIINHLVCALDELKRH
ncbi:hypothetical protein CKO09_09565 [Chromatium weissei]|nr:hypothetical protein [Chromatium weissei]